MFILSKLVGLLLKPFFWVLACFILAWIFRKKPARQRWIRYGIMLFLFFSNPWIINSLINRHQPAPAQIRPGQVFSCGIVLGGMAGYDAGYERPIFGNASDRFIQAARLYKMGVIRKIMVSGGNASLFNKEFKEALFLRQSLLDLGIPDADILVEFQSRNTWENAQYSKLKLDSAGLKPPYVLVTSAFHMPRSEWIFRKQGMPVTAYPCAYISRPGPGFDLGRFIIPSPVSFEYWDLYLKEMVGLLFYRMRYR